MKVILKNTTLTLEKFQSGNALLNSVFTDFDATKHANFMQAIGGENGSIWRKIKLLYMPIYSTPEDGNIYFDLKSGRTVGYSSEVARQLWQRSEDVNNSDVKGYKETLVENQNVRINLPNNGLALTPENICFFCLSAHNPNPSNSLNDARFTVQNGSSAWTLEFKNTKTNYQVNFLNTGNSSIQQSKTITGFSKTMAVCTSNVNGAVTLVTNNGSNASTQVSGVTNHSVTEFFTCGRERSNDTIYGELFTIQGLADGLTVEEAETMVSALEIFLQ